VQAANNVPDAAPGKPNLQYDSGDCAITHELLCIHPAHGTKMATAIGDQFWDQLPLKKTKEDVVLSKALSFEYLLKTSSDNFVKNVKTNEVDVDLELFEYKGSLKIPPYTEGVQWMISKKVHYVGNKQLTKLKKIWFRFL